MPSAVYTKTGDKGQTSLYTGERVSKASLRVETYGTIDELQAVLGLARTEVHLDEVREIIYNVERNLWLLMSDIASLGKEPSITEENVVELEKIIDSFDERLEPLTKFIIPGDDKQSAYLHMARTVVRRAERALWRVVEAGEEVHDSNMRYLNRLSDLCYILARAESEL